MLMAITSPRYEGLSIRSAVLHLYYAEKGHMVKIKRSDDV